MRWDDIDFGKKTIRFRVTKGDLPYMVPISDTLAALLTAYRGGGAVSSFGMGLPVEHEGGETIWRVKNDREGVSATARYAATASGRRLPSVECIVRSIEDADGPLDNWRRSAATLHNGAPGGGVLAAPRKCGCGAVPGNPRPARIVIGRLAGLIHRRQCGTRLHAAASVFPKGNRERGAMKPDENEVREWIRAAAGGDIWHQMRERSWSHS